MRSIPITPMLRRYQNLFKGQKERLKQAEQLLARPDELAREFAESVQHFASYENADEPFYPLGRKPLVVTEEIRKTNDLVSRLAEQQRIEPVDASDRVTEHSAGPAVRAISAASLACNYVDREILVQRTTSPSQWEDDRLGTEKRGTHGDPRRNVGGLRLDVVLADAADSTPIVGEVKLPGDKDPFFALIQGLACAAHLATPAQYGRMCRQLERGNLFSTSATARPLDIWLLFVERPDYQAQQTPKGEYLPRLQRATRDLAALVLAQDVVRSSLRRIAGVRMKLERTSNSVTSEMCWAWTSSGA